MGMHLQLFQSGFFGLFIEQTHLSYWHVLASFFCICFNFVCLSVCFFSLPLSLSVNPSVSLLFCFVCFFGSKFAQKNWKGNTQPLKNKLEHGTLFRQDKLHDLTLHYFWADTVQCYAIQKVGAVLVIHPHSWYDPILVFRCNLYIILVIGTYIQKIISCNMIRN